MAVFSITCFRLNLTDLGLNSAPLLSDIPFNKQTASLRAEFCHALRILKASSKHPFHLLQDMQDTSLFYYIGKWANVESCLSFSKSDDRRELMDTLAKLAATTEWRGLYQFLPPARGELSLLPFRHKPHETMQAGIIGVTRHNVATKDVDIFEKELAKGRPALEKFSDHKAASGLRIALDGEHTISSSLDPRELLGQHDEREEFVVVSGWESMERFNQFATTEEYREYAQIKGWAKWFERRVAKVIVLE